MLTKNLLKGRIIEEVMKPTYITPKNALGADASETICDIAFKCNGKSYSYFKNQVEEAGISTNPYVPALMKVLKDEFISHQEVDFETLRWEYIKASEAERVMASSYEEFQKNIEERFNTDFDKLKLNIYGDLDEEVPISVKEDLTSENLIQRYNYATAQGFLIKAEEIKVSVSAHVSLLRQLFSKIKFLGLFIEELNVGDSAANFKISGPLSVVSSSKAYGIKFSGILKSLCEFEKWSLEAEIIHNEKKALLIINEKSPISRGSKEKKKANYIPEEVSSLIKMFNKKENDWVLEANSQVINLGNEVYCFPEFRLKTEKSGEEKYIELFNKWNKTALLTRLGQISDVISCGLLLGIDRNLAKDKEIAKKIEKMPAFQSVGFVFRDLPTTKVIESLLG